MLRQVKPKTARSARALAARAPQVTENPKTVLLLRYTTTSSLLSTLLTDIHRLKRPHSVRFTKKNSIHPFEDPSSLEFFAGKNDTSLLLFASHSKKRPHALTFIRCFDGRLLDMMEVLVVQDSFRGLEQFKGQKPSVGVKPLLSFSGAGFEGPGDGELKLAKSLFLDFFRGQEAKEVDVEGLQMLISFFAPEMKEGDEGGRMLHMRVHKIVTRRSGQKVPRVEVEEIGPRVDMRVGRCREADEGVWREAMKKGKMGEERRKKNVETDVVGDKMGRIHLGRQDLGELQTRKMKGLKRGRVEVDGGGEGEEEAEEDVVSFSEGEEGEAKRLRIA